MSRVHTPYASQLLPSLPSNPDSVVLFKIAVHDDLFDGFDHITRRCYSTDVGLSLLRLHGKYISFSYSGQVVCGRIVSHRLGDIKDVFRGNWRRYVRIDVFPDSVMGLRQFRAVKSFELTKSKWIIDRANVILSSKTISNSSDEEYIRAYDCYVADERNLVHVYLYCYRLVPQNTGNSSKRVSKGKGWKITLKFYF